MIYNFKFRPEWKKKSQYKYSDVFFTKIVYALYRNKLFQRLKLDKDDSIKEGCFPHLRPFRDTLNLDFPEHIKLNVQSLTFIDSIEIQDADKLRNRLLKITSKYKSAELLGDTEDKLRKTFAGFNSFKTIVTGKFHRNNTKDNLELDLIDAITFGFVKCEQSHIVITYTVVPSQKFHDLFRTSLKTNIDEEYVINFNPIRTILKKKRLYSSIGHSIKPYGYLTERLFDEVNYQVKEKVVKSLKLGFYNTKKRHLFPQIVAFEYDPEEFTKHKSDFLDHFDISLHEIYDADDFSVGYRHVYTTVLTRSMELFFPKFERGYDAHNYGLNVGYRSDRFISAVAPTWLLLNVSSFYKEVVVSLREKTYKYTRTKRIGLFLKRSIKLRHALTIDWMSFERLRKDMSGEIVRSQLRHISDAFTQSNETVKPEFKGDLLQHTNYLSAGIKASLEELLEQYRHINDENTFRANMRLQRLLFIFAVVGTILTLYTANSVWFNEWLKYWGFSLPHPTQ